MGSARRVKGATTWSSIFEKVSFEFSPERLRLHFKGVSQVRIAAREQCIGTGASVQPQPSRDVSGRDVLAHMSHLFAKDTQLDVNGRES
jgi:hypothetical protein